MFLGYFFIAIGLAILLSTLGIMNGTFWGIFWAAFFIAIGLKIMMKKGKCPMCGWGMFMKKNHNDSCCGCECEHVDDEKQV